MIQQPTQTTAFIFNSSRQPVTQTQVTLAHTLVTCDEQGDSFRQQLADLHLIEVLYTTEGERGYRLPAVWASCILKRVYKTRIPALSEA